METIGSMILFSGEKQCWFIAYLFIYFGWDEGEENEV